MPAWTPPANGTICWIEIPVTNPERGIPLPFLQSPSLIRFTDISTAKKFYSTVFSWTFHAPPPPASTQTPCNETVALFMFPDGKMGQSLSGGLSLVTEEEMERYKMGDGSSTDASGRGGRTGTTLYYIVEDLPGTMDVSTFVPQW